MWYGDPRGADMCHNAKEAMNRMDEETHQDHKPIDALSTDIPASEGEILSAGEFKQRQGETLCQFIERTCVWCARSKGGDRTRLEFLVRSQGIWLHALQYTLTDHNSETSKVYTSDFPVWSCVKTILI